MCVRFVWTPGRVFLIIYSLLTSLWIYYLFCFFFFLFFFFFLMFRRPPRSTQSRSSAASDVYKRQLQARSRTQQPRRHWRISQDHPRLLGNQGQQLRRPPRRQRQLAAPAPPAVGRSPVSYTHLRAHETVLDLVCRLLLEKKKRQRNIRA